MRERLYAHPVYPSRGDFRKTTTSERQKRLAIFTFSNLLKQLTTAPTLHSQVAMLSDDTHANQWESIRAQWLYFSLWEW